MGPVAKIFGGGKMPTPAPLPAAPTADSSNTSAATTAAAQPGPGRAANIVAGTGPDLNDTGTDQYSVKKKLLGDAGGA